MTGRPDPFVEEITTFGDAGAKALSPSSLKRMAMAYLARRGTSSSHLHEVLFRKARRWHARRSIELDEARVDQDITASIASLVSAGFVDDAAFADARSRRLLDKGLPAWRVHRELAHLGVAAVAPLLDMDAERQAHRYATRKRLGPYRLGDRAVFREKDLRSLVRAGFAFPLAAALVDGPPLDLVDFDARSSPD